MRTTHRKKIIALGALFTTLLLLVSVSSLFAGAEVFETRGDYEIKDGQVIFDFELINCNSEAKQLQFSSGQQFEVIITNEDGKEVYRYSDGRAFTMALIYKTLEPGESLKWQDTWNLTNKEGEKLTSGTYTVEISILSLPEEIEDSRLTLTIDLNLETERLIEETVIQVMEALRDKDAETISAFVHPVKGVRFTPYTYVSLEQDVVLNQEAVKNFFTDDNVYLWGYYDGTGDDISLTPAEYYQQFIYSQDFINASKIGYNEVLGTGNMLENQFEVYDNPIIVEYYFPGFNLDYAGMDWESLRLVFEQYEDSWKLTGIIHNQWTI